MPIPDALQLSPEVTSALEAGRPVVALESTVITHGLPQQVNLEVARRMEAIIREQSAMPATIAVLRGKIRVGLDDAELEYLATAKGIRKVSCRDLPVVVALGLDGGTTVAATATVSAWAGITVFATGGIGGVHRDPPSDVSNDLPTLASTPVAVVCAGAKSILDLPATLEWLETTGVPVIGYQTSEFPAFYTRSSGLPVAARVDTAQEAASIILAGRRLGLLSGMLVCVPIPDADEIPAEQLETAIAAALTEARDQRIGGNASTPFLLRRVAEHTGGESLRANVALLYNNALVAAQIATALSRLR